jgi:hypothetical protein
LALVDAEISDWLKTVNALRDEPPHPFEKIAAMHAAFERVHPFFDGNGRTGRLLLNLILVRLGMPPAIIYARERTRYMTALARADVGDTDALAELLARAVLNNLNRLMLPKLAGPARFVPIATLADARISHGRYAAPRRAEGCARFRTPSDSGSPVARTSRSTWHNATANAAARVRPIGTDHTTPTLAGCPAETRSTNWPGSSSGSSTASAARRRASWSAASRRTGGPRRRMTSGANHR